MCNCEDIPSKVLKGKFFVRVWYHKKKKSKFRASGVRKSRWCGTFFQNFQKIFSDLLFSLKSSFNAIAAILNFAKKNFSHYPNAHTLAPLMRALLRVRARFGELLRSHREHTHSHPQVELKKKKKKKRTAYKQNPICFLDIM